MGERQFVGDSQNLMGRRWLLGVTLMAAEQATTILDVCATTPGDDAELNRALREALEVSSIDAEVILSLQMRRFSPSSIARIRAELHEVESLLDSIGTPEGDDSADTTRSRV